MKICTITCHDVYNHGASLQAYALMRFLQNSGHDVEIIDYKPNYLSNHYNLLSINNPKWKKNILTKAIYLIVKIPTRIPELKRKKAFDRFTSNFLKLTKKRYESNDDLKGNVPVADAYICGSDQIWNTLYENGKDPAFFLDFAPNEKIKLSYAASFATDTISNEYKPIVRERVKFLDGVGVREKSGVKILEGLEINNAVNVVDPVFLLNKKDWISMCSKEYNEKYILVYDFDNNNLIKKIALEIREKTGFKIYSINARRMDYVNKNFIYDGPDTFISLVSSAQFVIANSFHAAVFSIIFEKNFAIVNRKEAINTRMRDLLDDLKLNERLVMDNSKIDLLLEDIDYSKTKKVINEKIKFSKGYLENILAVKK